MSAVQIAGPGDDVASGLFDDPASTTRDQNGVDTPGNTSSTDVLTVGDYVSGTVTGADHDWYRVTLTAGIQYAFATQTSSDEADTILSLRNASGVQLVFDDDSGAGTDSLLTFTPTVGGTYFIDVGQFDSTGTADYALVMSASLSLVDSVLGTILTSATLAVGGSLTGALETFDDADWYAVTLTAGQSYRFTLDGTGSPSLTDPYLRLYSAGGTQVAFDDDSGPGTNSALRFTPTTSGTYYISAEAFSVETGNYRLALSEVAPQNPLDTIDWGTLVASTQVKIYFAHTGETFHGSTATQNWSSAQMAAALAAGAAFSAVSNLTVTQVSSAAQATMVLILKSGMGAGVLGESEVPPTAPTVSSFNPTYMTESRLQPGGIGFAVILHEMGHALGMAHPHDGGGSSEIMEGVTDEFDSYGTFELNQGVYTIMSYNQGYPSVEGGFPGVTDTVGHQASPMALDIAVLQEKYGLRASNAGDTVYTLESTANRFVSLWDTGGTDAITYSGSSGVIIDLRAASLLNAFGGGGYVSRLAQLGQSGGHGGYTIAAGVTIENATGGSGADTLTGNEVINRLTGGGGADTINGGGNVDTAIFSGARSAYSISTNSFTATVSGPDGTDTLTNVEFFQFSDQTFHWRPGTATAVNFAADPDTFMDAIRDFDGNNVGAPTDWLRIGQADLQGDGDIEQVFVNRVNGRWASVGPAENGLVYFDDHGWAGDTRVVGIYVDPLVQNGQVVQGGPNDSQQRFQNDLNIENIHGVLGSGDYDHDGLQEVYFSLTDGTAFLHAYMHADGNVRYANYQSQAQVIDYLTGNGFGASTWNGWFA